jgi:2-polyprenyl-3-methyl-5-hydroxy-6-metoxy-1,4-benzoquinol methylase
LSASRYITACPVGCAAALAPTPIVLPEGALLRCAECGQLVSQSSAEHYWATMRAFDASAFNQPAGRELARRNQVARRRLGRVAALARKQPRDMRLLDVGCSRGHFVAAAAQMGFRAEGVEPAPQIAEAARASGLTVHTGLLDEQHFPEHAFDAVTCFEVLEHLTDPLPLVHECRRILAPGGVLCVTTGNAQSWSVSALGAKWDYFRMDKDAGHVSFYTPRSLALLAQRAGLSVIAVDTARVRFSEKGEAPRVVHAAAKLAAELLSYPARLAGRGHDMTGWFRRV